MAKQQSFVDKSKKKGGSDFISVKVVTAEKSVKGTVKFTERFVKVKDLGEVEAAIKR
jgi:hypothetical protein